MGNAQHTSRWLLVAADALVTSVYVALLFLVPSRFWAGTALLGGMVVAGAAMGLGTAVPRRWSWYVAVSACGALLFLEVVMLFLLATSAAFLFGVYGSFGVGAASLALLVALVSFQLVALLPTIQLFFLTRQNIRLLYR